MNSNDRIMTSDEIEAALRKHERFLMASDGTSLCDHCYGPSGQHQNDCILNALWHGVQCARQLDETERALGHALNLIERVASRIELAGGIKDAQAIMAGHVALAWRERFANNKRAKRAADGA